MLPKISVRLAARFTKIALQVDKADNASSAVRPLLLGTDKAAYECTRLLNQRGWPVIGHQFVNMLVHGKDMHVVFPKRPQG